MKIGIPKEIKNNEFRVGMVPAGVRVLSSAGHRVLIQKNAGKECGITDENYMDAGATVLETADEIWGEADMIIKVKEPLSEECLRIRENQILFTYLHLAPAPQLTRDLLQSKCIGVAYETIQLNNGSLPLLAPMSEVAGRLAPQAGASYLEKSKGGMGILLGGVTGVERAKVTIIGGGVVGLNAAKIAIGFGADVFIIDKNMERLAYLDDIFGSAIQTVSSTQENIARHVAASDLVIGAALVPGALSPSLVTKEMVCIDEAGFRHRRCFH